MQRAIQPIQCVIGKPQANFLRVQIIADDLASMATLYWQLISETTVAAVMRDVEVTDEEGNVTTQSVVDVPEYLVMVEILTGNDIISGPDYTGWNGNNDYPYQRIVDKFGLTLI